MPGNGGATAKRMRLGGREGGAIEDSGSPRCVTSEAQLREELKEALRAHRREAARRQQLEAEIDSLRRNVSGGNAPSAVMARNPSSGELVMDELAVLAAASDGVEYPQRLKGGGAEEKRNKRNNIKRVGSHGDLETTGMSALMRVAATTGVGNKRLRNKTVKCPDEGDGDAQGGEGGFREHNHAVETLQQLFDREPDVNLARREVVPTKEGGGTGGMGASLLGQGSITTSDEPNTPNAVPTMNGTAPSSTTTQDIAPLPCPGKSLTVRPSLNDAQICAAVSTGRKRLLRAAPLALKEKAMEELQDGITIADFTQPDQPLIYCNAGFTRITGYSKEMTLGRNCRFLQGKGTNPDAVGTLRSTMSSWGSCVVQLVNYTLAGEAFINHLSLTPITDEDGQLTHYVGIQSNITELLARRAGEISARAEAAKAAAATEAKSKFLANMSHEIRTPLNGIIAVGQMLADSTLSAAQMELVTMIRSSGEVLLSLITDILDFSRIEANKLVIRNRPFCLVAVIESAIEISGVKAAQKKINLAYCIKEDVHTYLKSDANRLQQILLNLLNNAVKFTERGQVLLEVWQRALSPSDDKSETDYVEVNFSVRDTGIGISEEGLAKLFQSFSQVDNSHTRQYGGSGLGLAISRRMCEAMGGRMWADSPGVGRGSRFHFCIRAQLANEEKDEEGGGEKRKKKIAKPTTTTPGVDEGDEEEEHDKDGDGSSSDDAMADVEVETFGQTQRVIRGETAEFRPESPRTFEHSTLCTVPELVNLHVLVIDKCSMVRSILSRCMQSWGMRVTCCEHEYGAVRMLSSLFPGNNDWFEGMIQKQKQHDGNNTLSGTTRASKKMKGSGNGGGGGGGNERKKGSSTTNLFSLSLRLSQCGGHSGGPSLRGEEEGGVGGGGGGGSKVEGEEEWDNEAPRVDLGKFFDFVIFEPGCSRLPVLLKTISTKNNMNPPKLIHAFWPEVPSMLSVPEECEVPKFALNSIPTSDENGNNEQKLVTVAGLECLSMSKPVRQRRLLDAIMKLRAQDGMGEEEMKKEEEEEKEEKKKKEVCLPTRILIAEDNAINMRVALGVLKRMSQPEIQMAKDGIEALDILEQNSGPSSFDLILMDLHMPRMGGIETMQEIKRIWPEHATPVVAITADAFEESKEKCKMAGFSGWLTKPFRVEELAAVLGKCEISEK